MARLEVRFHTDEGEIVVGHLLNADRTIFFQYAETFFARGIELSPFKLPLSITEPIEERERTYHGLHGLFNDSLPDGWGLIVMERALRNRGIDLNEITALDRLAFLGSRTMGALTYHPSSESDDAEILDLDLTDVAENSHRILEGSTEDILPEIVKAGGSPMGARPKVLAGVRADFGHLVTGTAEIPEGYSHWLIKFSAREDPEDMGSIEMAYAEMARIAGLTVPKTNLFRTRDGKGYFGVERFDRDSQLPSRRIHTHTLAGLLHHDHRTPGQDYHDLMKVTRVLTQDHENVLEAFRRMVFNIVAYNRDDHTKNFAFQMEPAKGWRLSPAYDITYSAGIGGEHTLMIAGEGRVPTRLHVDAIATEASIDRADVAAIVDQALEAVGDWTRVAKAHGVSIESRRRIEERLKLVREASSLDRTVVAKRPRRVPGPRRRST